MGLLCKHCSARLADDAWLAALPQERRFFPLADPGRGLSLRDVLLEARDRYLRQPGAAEPEPALAIAPVVVPGVSG